MHTDAVPEGTQKQESASPVFSKAYLMGALAILFLINLINYMDRFIMTILVEPVRKEFHLSDTQAGMLTGLGFALIYALMILPIARISDRYSRRNVLAIAVAAWSVLTMLCGAAGSFAGLMLARAGVGVGEAAGLPASHSLASDYFPSHRRAMALAVIGVGGAMGSTLGLIIGGFVSRHYGWREAFAAAGLPGLALTLLIILVIREPRRGHSDQIGNADDAGNADMAPIPFATAVGLLLTRKAYVHVVAATALAAFSSMAIGAWTPAFYMRVHHVPSDTLSLWLAASHIFGTLVGTLAGGWVCTRFYRAEGSTLLRSMSLSFILVPPLGLAVFLIPGTLHSLLLNTVMSFFVAFWLPAYYTAQQELAGARYRATAAAFGLIFFNLVGSSLGPLFVGKISDLLVTSQGVNSLRFALSISLVFLLWALLHVRLAARTMAADIAAARG